MSVRRFVRLAWIVFSIAACSAPVPSPSKIDAPTGILMLAVGEQVQSRPPTEDLALAVSRAMELAQANGTDLGYPWFDPVTGELVLSVVTSRGRELIEAAGITAPHRIRVVAHGAGELQRIQDDVTFLHARGVPDSELIYSTYPDHRDNRTVIVISAMSLPLLAYLEAHYPADTLAVNVDPSGFGGGTGSGAEDSQLA